MKRLRPFQVAATISTLVLLGLGAVPQPGPTPAAPSQAAGQDRIFLPAVTNSDDPTKVPTTLDLILTAEQNGSITSETALLYRTYAEYGDPRLPAQFAGLPVDDENVLEDVQAAWPSISAATRITLTTFMLTPTDPASWYSLRNTTTGQALDPGGTRARQADGCLSNISGWSCVSSAQQRVKVWWKPANPGDGEKASAILAEVEGTIWPTLTGIMKREPFKDDSYTPANGGDGLFDIYLVQPFSRYNPARSQAYPELGSYAAVCRGPRPSFIVLANDSGVKYGSGDLYDIIAHEFMHALQWSSTTQTCQNPDYSWLKEATAVWAESAVYPKVGDAKWNNRSYDFYNYPEVPLDKKSHGFGYGAWLFPLFVERTGGGTDTVRKLWDATATNDSLLALDTSIEGGLSNRWREFIRMMWNQSPYDFPKQWEGVTLKPLLDKTKYIPPIKVVMSGQPSQFYIMQVSGLPRLSARYFQFTFEDESARSVLFDNTLVEATDAAATVQALIKIEGKDWEVRDWTNERKPRFCRDAKDERIEELVVIVGNHAYSKTTNLNRDHLLAPAKEPKITFSNVGCWRWAGTVDATFSVDQASPLRKTAETLKSEVTFGSRQPTASESASLTDEQVLFRVLPTNSGKGNKPSKVDWQMIGGVKDYPQFDKKGCTVLPASETVLLDNSAKTPSDATLLIINAFGIDTPEARRYDGSGSHFQSLFWGDVCPDVDGPPLQDGKGMTIWWRAAFSSDALANLKVSNDGTTIEGTSTGTVFASDGFGGFVPGTIEFRWKLTSVRE